MVTTRSSLKATATRTVVTSTIPPLSSSTSEVRPAKRAKTSVTARSSTTRVVVAQQSEYITAPESEKTRKSAVKKRAKAKAIAAEPDPTDFTPRTQTAWKIGAHVSAAGGVQNAIVNAAKLGANAFALFLKSQRRWEGPPMAAETKETFRRRLSAFGYDQAQVLPHGNYLMNMGSPNLEMREKSYRCFVDELRRCEELGLTLYNFHPGSTTGGCTVPESLVYIAECINRAHKETMSVVTVIENMAGAGNVVGGKFEHIEGIIKLVEDKTRVGVCLDTCHMFAAGYDIRTKAGWTQTMDEFDKIIGLRYLRGMHLNDSKAPFDARKDRHANIGQGEVGLPAFAAIISDERTRSIPLILETPSNDDEEVWRAEIEVLHQLVGDAEDKISVEESAKKIGVVVKASEEVAKQKKESKKKKKSTTKRKAGEEESDEDEDGGE